MQKITWLIIFLYFLNNFFYIAAFLNQQPLLIVTIMVKNEAEVMEATLKPFLETGLQYYLVLDTGSTDNTIQVVKNLFKKYKIQHGHIVEQPFVNFAVSRNYALESAEQIFPNAVFFLMVDAEWYVHNIEGLVAFCEKYQNHSSVAYLIKRSFPFYHVTDYGSYLFKAHKGVRFQGAVHECINKFAEIKVPDNVFITYNESRTGREKSSRRWHKDLEILHKEHEKDPNNLRTIFHLGQTYACLQNYEKALFWYGKRCTNQKNDEENYQAHYRIGLIYQLLENWPLALLFYFKAHHIRSQRIEPLIRIAQHYLDIQNYYTAFLLANYTTTIPVSFQEQLAMSPEMYNFTRYDILSQAAWYIGEYEIGRQATLKALEHDPFNTELQKKLRLYEQTLNHKDCNFLYRNYWCKWCNGYFWMNRPTWFNFSSLAHGCCKSNRCNLSQGITWRYWVGPFYLAT